MVKPHVVEVFIFSFPSWQAILSHLSKKQSDNNVQELTTFLSLQDILCFLNNVHCESVQIVDVR